VTTPHCHLELFLPGAGFGSLNVTEFVYFAQKWRILKTICASAIRPMEKLRRMILDES